MATIFISHPFSSDPDANGTRVAAIARELALEGHLPLAPQIYLPSFVDEAGQRDLALYLCRQLVSLADEVWVYGKPTDGMCLEIAEARRLGILVVEKELP